jgi:hypothetical protein
MSRGRQGAPAWWPLGRCSRQKPAPCAVVVIDEDDDGEASDSEVFIVDADTAGKTFPTTSRCQAKKGEGSSGGNVIDLDDDDDDEVEEVSRGDKAGPSAARGAGSPAAATTTPGLASPRNRYGLDCTSDGSESDLSKRLESESDDSEPEDSSASDCEIMDDTSGTARKMWESAASSRKRMPNGVHKGKEAMATASTSSSGSETQPGENAGGLFGSEFHLHGDLFQFFQATDNGGTQNGSGGTRDGPAEDNYNSSMYFGDAQKREQSSTYGAKDAHDPSKNSHAECHINESFQHFSHGDKEADPFTTGSTEVDCDPSTAQNANECSNGNVSNGKRPCSSASPILESDTAGNDKTAQFHNGAVPEKASLGIQSPHLDQTFDDSFVPAKMAFPASSSPYWKDGSSPMSISTPEKMDERVPEEVCSRKDQSPSDVHNVTSGSCVLPRNDLVDDPNGLGQFTLVDSLDGLIGEREKLKETAEFKRAAEEEWASRQRQLQIQVKHLISFN